VGQGEEEEEDGDEVTGPNMAAGNDTVAGSVGEQRLDTTAAGENGATQASGPREDEGAGAAGAGTGTESAAREAPATSSGAQADTRLSLEMDPATTPGEAKPEGAAPTKPAEGLPSGETTTEVPEKKGNRRRKVVSTSRRKPGASARSRAAPSVGQSLVPPLLLRRTQHSKSFLDSRLQAHRLSHLHRVQPQALRRGRCTGRG